jgi:hypothetical protein
VNDQRAWLIDLYPRRTPWRQAATHCDGRFLAMAMGLVLLVAAAGLLYLSQASTAAGLRYRLTGLRDEQSSLHEDIALLRVEIAANASCLALEERTQRLGLIDAPAGTSYAVCYVPAQPAPGNMSARAAAQPALTATARIQPSFWERVTAFLTPEPKQQAMRTTNP